MPIYDYRCPQCGPFSRLRPLAEHDRPLACPECDTPAPRCITAPHLATTSSAERHAHEVNERSRESPRCRHGHTHDTSTQSDAASRKHLKATPGKRPWMLGH